MLRNNQNKAIKISIENDFKSGVHFHATGTGKSWIGLELILEYNKKYPKRNILWLCEQKSILIEQFRRDKIKEKGYNEIYKRFLIINYTENKDKYWYSNINSAKIWNKAILIIINRSFLVSRLKYKKIILDIDLIIHDECHSITNKTTRLFYNYMIEKNERINCIGFSATPVLEYKPYNKILSSYTIYDGFKDGVILPPKINWIKSKEILNNIDIIKYTKCIIKDLYYKKIIIWCGMINNCIKLSKLWSKYFKDFLICIDISKDIKEDIKSIDYFYRRDKNAILFCAAKHREGSDIKNLDCCIFLDKVENRNSKTFIQCIGRVLRKDENNKKKYGLIIDLKAKNCLKICDKMNEYLCSSNKFPWDYKYKELKINKKKIINYELLLIKKESKIKYIEKEYIIDDLLKKLKKKIPEDEIYKKRLNKEIKLIEEKKLIKYLLRAVEILELIKYIPHVTRGSCGSSLVCYLLGISNVDPVKNNIKFERFLNKYRDNLPDIDFDFPHYLRDEVFLKLELKWPNQVARISNHVCWHKKSAIREGLRRMGIKKMIPKEKINKYIKELSKDKKEQLKNIIEKLDNTFRHYSLHCGGIVFYHNGIPDEIILEKNKDKTIRQIIYNKRDISKKKNFKIDILSSRAISQLMYINKEIDFMDCPYDRETYKLLQKGDNIGITLAESPLIRKAMIKIKPKSIDDIAKCLAIIRPAAKDARDKCINLENEFIYDDDAITLLSKNLNISYDLADKYRRCLSKNKWKEGEKEKFDKLLNNLSIEKKKELKKKINNLRKYSFCKSHSYSYAQLVYKLAYEKAHNKKRFWEGTLLNIKSSYKKWVHLYEAKLGGVNVYKYLMNSREKVSIYAENRRKKIDNLNKYQQLKKYGYWNMKDDDFFNFCYIKKEDGCYRFNGIVASIRIYVKKIITLLCVGKNKYIEMICKDVKYYNNHIGIKGTANILDPKINSYEAIDCKLF